MIFHFEQTCYNLVTFFSHKIDDDFEVIFHILILQFDFFIENELSSGGGADIICDFLLLVRQMHFAGKFDG